MSTLCVSDNSQNKLVIVDLGTMSIAHTVSTGKSPYPVDRVSTDKVFVSTRGEQSILPVDFKTGKSDSVIPLPHKPRSTSSHASRTIALVGGVESSLTTVVDTSTQKALFSVGKDDRDTRRDFGGGLACGHPAWVSDNSFLHLDRVERRLELFDLNTRDQLSWCNLPTSPHHIAQGADSFYAMCEGNRQSLIPPSVVKFQVVDGVINIEQHKFLPVPLLASKLTGAHHLTIDIKNNRVYIGTADARLYTLDALNLDVLNIIDTGSGCGHVTLCPEIGLGVTTNHTDTFMTVFELLSGRKCSDILVSSPQVGKKKTQGHSSKWYGAEGLLYTTAAQDGKVLEIDPTNQTIIRELEVEGAYLLQGTFV